MVIEIARPVFKCADDENVFLSRIHGIAGYETVIGRGNKLYLTVTDDAEGTAITQLQEVCAIWHTNFKVVDLN